MLMDIETGSIEKKRQKKIKDPYKTDRLIARMILGIGLSLTIASAVACGITHPKFSDVKSEHWDAVDNKNAYLDTFEQSDEFKTTYNADVNSLNNRLIAREIDGNTYDKELDKLNTNEYTEKVLIEKASEQTKAEFNEINQRYLDTKAEWEKQSIPSVISAGGAFAMPMTTLGLYYIWKPRKAKEKLGDAPMHHISEETFERVMKLKDLPPYQPINAEETQQNQNQL